MLARSHIHPLTHILTVTHTLAQSLTHKHIYIYIHACTLYEYGHYVKIWGKTLKALTHTLHALDHTLTEMEHCHLLTHSLIH